MAETDDNHIRVVALAGSLRERSFNRGLLRAAIQLAPPGVMVEEAPIRDLPHFDDDLDVNGGAEAVRVFRTTVAAADAVLFITPEYNHSLPGVLKNAIDWGSRPMGRSAFNGKPAAIMGAASGRSGTMRAQLHLRQILATLNMPGLNKPEVVVTFAGDKFDEQSELIEEQTKHQIRDQLHALREWVMRLRT